jgi:hypothetical protein
MDMEHAPDLHPHVSRPGYLAEVTIALLYIREMYASGRLSIRNGERFGLVHLYFSQAQLIHITGDKRDGEIILNDLLTWTKGAVRFDPAMVVDYETVTWQQAQIFARWLAFLEMRGIMQGIPRARLNGLVQSLTANLPVERIVLPEEVEYYEESEEIALSRQWQRLNEGVHHLIERSVPEEQRQQLRQVSQRVNGVVQQAGDITQELTKRAARATQEGVRQAAEVAHEAARQSAQRAEEIVKQALNQERRQQFIESTQRTVESVKQAAEAAQEAARQHAMRAEEFMRQTFNEDRRQQFIQSVQETVESVKQTVNQRVDDALSQNGSRLPPELQAKSVRPMRPFQSPSPATGGPGERQ